MLLLELYYEFFKIGLFAVGGGLATLPFLTDLAERSGWYTNSDVANLVAVSQSTPGPLGVNMATYVGFHVSGVVGSLVATLGLVTPSLIVIVLVAKFLQRFKENENVKHIFYGLRPASTALIAAAGIEVVKISLLNMELWGKDYVNLVDWKGFVLAAVLFFAMEKYKRHPFFYILAAGVIGIVIGQLN